MLPLTHAKVQSVYISPGMCYAYLFHMWYVHTVHNQRTWLLFNCYAKYDNTIPAQTKLLCCLIVR